MPSKRKKAPDGGLRGSLWEKSADKGMAAICQRCTKLQVQQVQSGPRRYPRTAAIPGNTLPSKYSNIAPPPVET